MAQFFQQLQHKFHCVINPAKYKNKERPKMTLKLPALNDS